MLKYATKSGENKLTDADAILAAAQHLNPENCVTPGIFQRAYNQASQMGPIPIFQAIHDNFEVPLFFKNSDPKFHSLSGISLVRKRTNQEETDEGRI